MACLLSVAAGLLYWVGAGTVAYLTLRVSYWLFWAFRLWGVGNDAWVGPRLGEWAGECESAPSPSPGLGGARRPLTKPGALPAASQLPALFPETPILWLA